MSTDHRTSHALPLPLGEPTFSSSTTTEVAPSAEPVTEILSAFSSCEDFVSHIKNLLSGASQEDKKRLLWEAFDLEELGDVYKKKEKLKFDERLKGREERSILGRKSSNYSIPFLLYQREFGLVSGSPALVTTTNHWIRRVITSNRFPSYDWKEIRQIPKVDLHCLSVVPRQLVTQTIRQSSLPMDVQRTLVGVSGPGSCLYCLGVNPPHEPVANNAALLHRIPPNPTLHFYGLPNAGRTHQESCGTPFLQTIPLAYRQDFDEWGNPVWLWTSKDFQVGVSSVYSDRTVSTVLFPFPLASSGTGFSNMPSLPTSEWWTISLRHEDTDLLDDFVNLEWNEMLWIVNMVPLVQSSGITKECNTEPVFHLNCTVPSANVPCYLFARRDVPDSYILTWFRPLSKVPWSKSEWGATRGSFAETVKGKSRHIPGLLQLCTSYWEECISDKKGFRVSPAMVKSRSSLNSGVELVLQARVHPDKILEDIRQRRPNILTSITDVNYRLTDLFQSRYAKMLIDFKLHNFPNMAIEVSIDLFNSSYCELQWWGIMSGNSWNDGFNLAKFNPDTYEVDDETQKFDFPNYWSHPCDGHMTFLPPFDEQEPLECKSGLTRITRD